MFKVLGRIGSLVKLASVLDDVIVIGFQILAARELFEFAVPGEELNVGDVKGIRAFGRRFDLPLRPHILE